MRGYSDEEVDIFLDEVADELEQLFQQNAELQDRLQRAEEQIATYSQVRDALEKTLISAQVQSEEIKAGARKESELILRDAQLKARSIVNDSYGETQEVQKALVGLKRLEEDFRFKFRSLLEGYLNLLNEVPITTTSVSGTPGQDDDATVASAAFQQADTSPPESTVGVGPSETGAASAAGAVAAGLAPEQRPPEPYGPERYEDEVPTEEAEMAVVEAGPAEVEEGGATTSETSVAAPVAEAVVGAEEVGITTAEVAVTESVAEMVTPPVAETVTPSVAEMVTPSVGGVGASPIAEAETPAIAVVDTMETGDNARGVCGELSFPDEDRTPAPDVSGHGFFFGRQLEDVDDTFPGEDIVRKDRTRDFEW